MCAPQLFAMSNRLYSLISSVCHAELSETPPEPPSGRHSTSHAGGSHVCANRARIPQNVRRDPQAILKTNFAYSELRVIRIQWDLKNNWDYAKIRITRRKNASVLVILIRKFVRITRSLLYLRFHSGLTMNTTVVGTQFDQ